MFWIKALIVLIVMVALTMLFCVGIVYRGGPMDLDLGQIVAIGALTVVQVIFLFGALAFFPMSRD